VGHKDRWGDNIKINVQEIGCEGMDWNLMVLNRVRWKIRMKMAMKIYGFIEGGGAFLPAKCTLLYTRKRTDFSIGSKKLKQVKQQNHTCFPAINKENLSTKIFKKKYQNRIKEKLTINNVKTSEYQKPNL
jgi:hypothetical protein